MIDPENIAGDSSLLSLYSSLMSSGIISKLIPVPFKSSDLEDKDLSLF